MGLLISSGGEPVFVSTDGALHVRRGVHVEPLLIGGKASRISHASSKAVAHAMLSIALEDGDPDARLVRAFAADVVRRLPSNRFELRRADIVAWVETLGSAQTDDLREEQRPLGLDELAEYRDRPHDPANDPVSEAGGGVAEGFEAAESALIAYATHAEDGGGDPLADAFPAETEAGAATVVYGQADDAS